MDGAAHERQGASLHGMVTAPRMAAGLLAAGVAVSLAAGILGGLLRTGVAPAALADAAWLPRAALAHAALMMCGFLGTVIGIERAVAAKWRFAWLAPLLSGMAAALFIAGRNVAGTYLLVAAGAAFVITNVLLWRRQRAPHIAVLLAGACAWCAGNVLLSVGAPATAVLPWWFAFLVLTIAAERLEMTRLMRRRPAAQPSLYAVLALLAAGAGLSAWPGEAGGVVFGVALVLLAAWLLAFDIARRVVREPGLPRYMAICLLSGYAWLALGGIAWTATALGAPARDAALHSLGLGFVFSMIMGHAPVILPAVARVKPLFGRIFYVPLGLLHASLLVRVAGGVFDVEWRAWGALLNALAVALFVATVAATALEHHG
jgi:hypothetical protein